VFVLLAFSLLIALLGLQWRHDRLLVAGVFLGFAVGGVELSEAAWQRAWRSTLRVAFEAIVHDQRADEERQGTVVPVDANASVVVVGRLRSDAAPTAGGGVSLDLDTTWIGRARSAASRIDPAVNPVQGGLLLTVVGDFAVQRMDAWRAGRTVRAFAQIHRPSRYLDEHVADQERLLARRGVVLVGTVKSAALVDVIERGGALSEAAASARARPRAAIQRAVGRWSARSAAIVAAIVIGDRTGLDDRTERRLQEAGTYHVIAISGGNIAILAGLALLAFRIAGFIGRTAMLTAILGLLAYAYLVGGGASVDRATWMAVVFLAARALDLRGPPLNALALVAGLLAVSRPLAVADPAFLLTFGATTAIVVVAADVPLVRLPRYVAPIASMLLASAAAEAALLPVGATFFSRVTLAGLVLNFAAIPLMAVAQIAGLLVVALAAVSSRLAAAAGFVAHLGAEGLVRTADLIEFAPWLTWRVAPPTTVASALYLVALVLAWRLWGRRRTPFEEERRSRRAVRWCAAAAAVACASWILLEPWRIASTRGDGRLHVTFLDVGQGDAAFIRFPDGTAWLVDSGGLGGSASFDVGDRVVAPTLRAAGVGRLDTLVLTHGDADHIGGAPAIVREFRPRDVWEGVPVPPFAPLLALHADARAVAARLTSVQSFDAAAIGGVQVLVRHPGLPDWERQRVRNDDSIVLELLWRSVSIVLTGDIGREVETTIARELAPAPIRIVKVPHHGSLTSSSESFVTALAARAAVVSVGRANRFGHPAPEVLERYERSGAEVFRTDRDGTVDLVTDGTSADMRTFTGRATKFTIGNSKLGIRTN
jgi:competence protein ComEC